MMDSIVFHFDDDEEMFRAAQRANETAGRYNREHSQQGIAVRLNDERNGYELFPTAVYPNRAWKALLDETIMLTAKGAAVAGLDKSLFDCAAQYDQREDESGLCDHLEREAR